MIYFIYETLNTANGKLYRGMHSTKNIEDGYLGSGVALIRAVKKYGPDVFQRTILEYCDSYESMIEREKEYVTREWVECYNTYNLKTGGQSAGQLSEESKNKISETLKKQWNAGVVRGMSGRKHTEESRIKISEIEREQYRTGERTAPFTGQTHTEEARKKMSEAHKGKIPHNKGKSDTFVHDEETKRRMSQTLKSRYAEQEHHLKGKKQERRECPSCGKHVAPHLFSMYHGDKCKTLV